MQIKSARRIRVSPHRQSRQQHSGTEPTTNRSSSSSSSSSCLGSGDICKDGSRTVAAELTSKGGHPTDYYAPSFPGWRVLPLRILRILGLSVFFRSCRAASVGAVCRHLWRSGAALLSSWRREIGHDPIDIDALTARQEPCSDRASSGRTVPDFLYCREISLCKIYIVVLIRKATLGE